MFVSVVSPEMTGDHVSPAGAVRTGGTLVRFLPCVSPLVGGEMVRPAEHLAAHLAAVGLVAGVEPHVPGEHVAPSECSLANLTEVSSAANTNTRVSGARLTTLTVNRVEAHEKLNCTLRAQGAVISPEVDSKVPCVCWPGVWPAGRED